jgi:7-keto-8-aminopelargonate synthetase-like enzyme
LSRAKITIYPHLDLGALERALVATSTASSVPRRKIVVSESLFSMDGDLADVGALAALCARHGASLILDEAHAVGAWGPEGRGVAAAAGVVPDVLVGTCGKALGSFGAFAATSKPIADLLWNRARPFVFSTGLPPLIPAAISAAIDIVRSAEGDERRHALATRARDLRARVPKLGGAEDSAIAPLLVGDDREVMQITARLLEQRIYVQGIRPPTVPEGTARLRVSLSAGHSAQDVETITGALNDAARHFT